MKSLKFWLLVLVGIVLLLATRCSAGGGQPDQLAGYLPANDVVAGWQREDGIQTFDSQNLFELVDGQAESYLAYGFDRVVVGRYVNGDQRLRIELYRLDSPADAFGLFSVTRSGQPVAVGNDGDSDPGRQLAFWQDRYYARLLAPQPLEKNTLMSFAQALAGALPSGGNQPQLVDRLPAGDRVPGSVRFFRQELSIQNWLWLGGANVLNLSPETEGLLAAYQREGVDFQFLLVAYPQSSAAQAAAVALSQADLPDLVTVSSRDTLLAAVFGDLDPASAETLIKDVLQ